MAAPGGVDAIIGQMMSADNEQRSAAEAAFNEARKNPDGLVGSLIQVLRSSPEAESRAFSAVMLRKVRLQLSTSGAHEPFARQPESSFGPLWLFQRMPRGSG